MEYAYPSTVSPIKTKVRSALREMLVFAAIVAMILFFAGSNTSFGLSILGGVIFCPVPWGIYKLTRFIIGV